MAKLDSKNADKFGFDNMQGKAIRNVGKPKSATDAMTWGVPSYTTIDRDALTAYIGMMIFNLTTLKLNFYNGTAWKEVTSA